MARKIKAQQLYYSDVAEIAKFIGLATTAQLWNAPKKGFDPFDRGNEPFIMDYVLLRWMCQNLPTELVRKAVGR